jgi:tungstate transport system ATP-binding protein
MTDMRADPSILPLVVEGLGFEADGRALLADVGFTLRRGRPTVVLGPNGAGKSLLLRLCHGLIAPGAGAVRWAADQGVAAGRKRHAMVFQKPVILRRSVRANLDHALSAAGTDSAGRAARTAAALVRFGLTALADAPARRLSGGEQQRLAIARAWALGPEVLFMDEPCANLDPGSTARIESLVSDLASEGVTVVMTTHDLGQARRLAERVLFLDKGRLVEDAPADRFFDAPETPQAAAFLRGDLLW